MKPVTFSCSGSAVEARKRLEAAIDGRPWNAAGLDGWIRGDGVVLYYRDAAKYRALFRRTFIGRFRERDGRTVLDGRFRMTLFARALLPVWLAPGIGFWRLVIGLLGFLAYGLFRPQLFRIDRKAWLLVGLGGGALVALFEVAYQFGIAGTGVAGAAALLYIAPVLVAILAKPLLGEKLTALRIVLALVVMAGAALTVQGGSHGAGATAIAHAASAVPP